MFIYLSVYLSIYLSIYIYIYPTLRVKLEIGCYLGWQHAPCNQFFLCLFYLLVPQIADWEDCKTAMQCCRISMNIQSIALLRFLETYLEIHVF
jgi:hypothetical protein